MKTAYIGLGSNLGDSLQIILDGWAMLGTIPGIHLGELSHPYRTEPVGMVSDNWFINAAGELRTSLPAPELLECLHRVERNSGRRRDPAFPDYRDRFLDFDLLLYDQKVLRKDNLHVPHPRLHERLFVLLPLSEIAFAVLHPLLDKSMGGLLAALQDTGENPVVEMMEWPSGKDSEGIQN